MVGLETMHTGDALYIIKILEADIEVTLTVEGILVILPG